ncbi:MAG: translation initiation factor IF-2 [Phycisphaerales bacterium]|nr:MAG: translation initiation factor IF-2 [Phycisphaerales bacterium]
MAKQLRVHTLAKELGVASKAILEKCRAEGLDVKNHMTALNAGLAATIREWFSEGQHTTTLEQSERVDLRKARVKPKRKKVAKKETTAAEADTTVAVAEAPPEEAGVAAEAPAVVEAPAPPEEVSRPAAAEAPAAVPEVTPEAPVAEPAPESPVLPPEFPPLAEPGKQEQAATPEPPPMIAAEAPAPEPEKIEPAGPQNVPAPAVLKGPRVIRVERPEPIVRPVPRERPPATRERAGEPLSEAPAKGGRRGRGGITEAEREGERRKGRAHPRRSASSEVDAGERLREWRERDVIERQERMQAVTGRGLHARRAVNRAAGAPRPVPAAKKSKVQMQEPIVLRDFCAETGIGMGRLMPKLISEHKIRPNITMTLPTDLAQLLALDFGIELDVTEARSALDELREQSAKRDRKNLQRRPPVVTFLGHVDHGKTSLLDRIRKTRVAEGESGGITQHIGAYRLDQDNVSVCFLDTPGHQAFTAMRARGAQMTDVVVLVVAADDGVMAQTVEAINHAKAGQVPIVVALNKIDLPGVDMNRVYGQLAEHGLVPTEWGGDVDVIKTSALTGEGLSALVEHLSTLSDLLNLRADPDVQATGTVIEANMKEGAGAAARVLVTEGRLRPGAIVVCGNSFGKVRALIDDRGRRVKEALPATPVEVLGLSAVPEAGDRLYEVTDLQTAKNVAEEVAQERRQRSLQVTRKPRSLEDLFREREQGKIPELNVIIRADVQGSVDVLRKTLGEIPTDQAKLNILHAGVGAITEGDVVLAEASNAIIFGFHVVADAAAERLATEEGVDIRLYRVIYKLTDDIRMALEGMLEPESQEETRGRAEVRDVFKISRVGVVAGCYVTDGIISRPHYLRVIRDGRIIMPTEEDVRKGRHREVESLRRFKEDVREVRSGLECGIRVAGFDDVKVDDIIESYEVVKVARKLE